MSHAPELDPNVRIIERVGERLHLMCGEGFVDVEVPKGTRVLYCPPPLPTLPDVRAAVEHALDHPAGSDPLDARLRSGMTVTIAFDDISLPLPQMRSPDAREIILEVLLERLARKGVTDIHLIAALALHRRMTPREIRHAVGPNA